MDNTILFFLVGLFIIGLLMLGYFAKGNGALMVVAIIVGVLLAMVAFFSNLV